MIFYFLWLASAGAYAQADQFRFKHLDVHQGLSNNQVNCFYKDSKGFMWIGTLSGLNRFDGYSFKIYRNNVRDSTSLPYNDIRRIFEDPSGKLWITTNNTQCIYDPASELFIRNTDPFLTQFSIPRGRLRGIVKDMPGNYWFIHETEGLFRYDPATKESKFIRGDSLKTTIISSFKEDSRGNFWIIYRNGLIEKLDGKNYSVTYRNKTLLKQYPQASLTYELSLDNDDCLWVHQTDYNRGVFYIDPGKTSVAHITTNSAGLRLSNDIVQDLTVAEDGMIWVATDHGGLNLIDKKKSTVHYVIHDAEDEKSLSQNSVRSIYKDDEGIIWLGTFKKGLNYYHGDLTKFALYHHQSSNPQSLPYDDINAFVEDQKGNFWIGTNGGGLLYFDRRQNTFRRYQHNPNNPNSLSNDVIVSLYQDHAGNVWIGTYFGGLNCFDGRNFTRYSHDADDPNSISDDNVWSILEDKDHNLWIGTLTGHLNLFDSKRKIFKHLKGPDGVSSAYVPALMQDKQGNLWVGTGFGINIFDGGAEGKRAYIIGDGKLGSLSNNNILAFNNDRRNYIWVGTQDGLNLCDKNYTVRRVFREEDGLPHNTIRGILEDDSGNLWLCTPNGLSNLIIAGDPASPSFVPVFKNYDESDGLQGKLFNERAVLKTRAGELVAGGPNGFNLFRPEEIRMNKKKPSVALVDFQIYNNSLRIGEEINGGVVLEKSITLTDAITLKYADNIFSIEFAALSFFHPEENRYKYKLEGFNKEWLVTDGNSRKITYTNLDPGKYTFRVIASNSDGLWNEEGRKLDIIILPPFWKTKWAIALYIFIILCALLLARQVILGRERLKYSLEKERQEAHRIHELDMMKIRFFTNVSHEFRTPLSLILTPIERILDNTKDGREKDQFQMIYRNARRLLNLVNQLLDFRKMEVQEIKLNPSEGDVVRFIEEVVRSFSDLSEKKNIQLLFESGIQELEMLFDQDKLEKILFNLLSNAFKFTPEGGKVSVGLSRIEDNTHVPWLKIFVKDTGIGIPAGNQDRIFERFFQNDLPRNIVNPGSGIGLSITKEFVRIHGGTISVESEFEKGSCFTVLIPIQELSAVVKASRVEEINTGSPMRNAVASDITTTGKKKPVVLLVEDNEDFRFYLKDNLTVHYKIVEAGNGAEAWDKVIQHTPDLIVSDVMIPGMSGVELCKKIKNDQRTAHIPVILLTARTATEQKLEGYSVGADDYVTKPFNFEILLFRIKNLISLTTSHRKASQKISVKASEVAITSLDETLIKNAIRLVEDKLADPDFSVEDLSKELGMSRVHLYKKLLSLTGKSPIEFIRIIRLQRAAQFLEKSQLTVAEVAYKVGFNNPKYFAKYFKEEYKVLPSQYASGKKE